MLESEEHRRTRNDQFHWSSPFFAITPRLPDRLYHLHQDRIITVAYASLLISALVLQRDPAPSLFAIGGTVLLLLFVGIHNTWGSVVYIALRRRQGPEGRGDQK